MTRNEELATVLGALAKGYEQPDTETPYRRAAQWFADGLSLVAAAYRDAAAREAREEYALSCRIVDPWRGGDRPTGEAPAAEYDDARSRYFQIQTVSTAVTGTDFRTSVGEAASLNLPMAKARGF